MRSGMMGGLRGWCLISLKVGFLAKVKVTRGKAGGPLWRSLPGKGGSPPKQEKLRQNKEPGFLGINRDVAAKQSPQGRHQGAPQTQASHRPACHAGKCTGGMSRDAEQEPWFIQLWGECARQSEEGGLPASRGL